MKRRLLLPIILLLLVSVGYAADQSRIAVLDFRNPAGLDQQEVDYITEMVRTEARKMLPRDRYILMTKENIQQMLPPDKRNLAECEGECEVETGRLIGAQYLVTGEIVSFGGELRLTVRLYDVTTGNLLESRRAAGKKVLDLERPIESLAPVLFAVLPGANKQPATMPAPQPAYSSTPEPYTPPANADPAFEKLVKEEQARIEAERRLAGEQKAQLEADYTAVKGLHDSASYSEDAKKAAYAKFVEKWPDDVKYTAEVKRWLAGGGLAASGAVWKDASSGLTWQVDPTGGRLEWIAAKEHCEHLSLGGASDWRLPTISELRSLIRGCPATEKGGSCGVTDSCLNRSCWKDPCKGCSSKGGPSSGGAYWPPELSGKVSLYWSSSAVADSGRNPWLVYFGSGHVDLRNVINLDFRVRCVR